MSAATTFETGGRHPFANGSDASPTPPTTTTTTSSSRGGGRSSSGGGNTAGSISSSGRPAGSRSSGRLMVTDLVESDTEPTTRSLKRKASPERASNDPYPVYSNDHVPSKQNRASASPALSALLNGPPSPPLRPTTVTTPTSAAPPAAPTSSPLAQAAPPMSTPPSTNASLATAPANRSPPQPKAVTDISKASTSNKRSQQSATSAPASPKPARAVPVAKSGGLLAGAFGDDILGDDGPDAPMPTVILHIALNGESNKYINVSKLAEDKYGWATLNPQLAKARGRIGLDASGDEAMMDASESESNMEDKPGLSDAGAMSGTGAPGEKKRKRRKADEYYDANDPFIDDSEMLWEEQAAASKDGFFVYSGPLVPEGERPQIERAAGGPPKRGRGRGGRGAGTGRGGGNAGKTAAPRKPRVTKAVKEKMEREKEERERQGLKVAAAMQAPKPIPA